VFVFVCACVYLYYSLAILIDSPREIAAPSPARRPAGEREEECLYLPPGSNEIDANLSEFCQRDGRVQADELALFVKCERGRLRVTSVTGWLRVTSLSPGLGT
jgi:hypothetical protein